MKSYQTKVHIWVYRTDGSRFVGKFDSKADARRWAKATNSRLGEETTAGRKRKSPSRPSSPFQAGYKWF